MEIVTGGAGFIGSHLVDKLLSEGKKVRVIDNLVTGNLKNLEQHKGNKNLDLVTSDINDLKRMEELFSGANNVYHLAARADIVPSIQDPLEYYKSNVDGTFCVLEAARKAKIQKLIYIASSTCYGIPEQYPTPENSEIQPQYPYALTKNLGEQMVMHWNKVYKIPCISLRCFNVYGPRARTSGSYGAVFGVFLAQMNANKPLTIVGDGHQSRDFTYVSDVVDAILCAAKSSVDGEIFNIGNGVAPISINQIVKLLGYDNITYIPKRPGEPDVTWADTQKIEKLLNWTAKVSIEEGVQIMLNHMDYWKDAPVWTPEKIADATKLWFECLGKV